MAIIKADLEGSVRLAEISADQLTVDHVRRHLGDVFEKPMLEGYELYYVADGDELVLIDSDEEFLAGLCENGSPFRVTIVQETHVMQSLVSCGMSLVDSAPDVLSDVDAQEVLSGPDTELVMDMTNFAEEDEDEEEDEDDDDVEEDDDDEVDEVDGLEDTASAAAESQAAAVSVESSESKQDSVDVTSNNATSQPENGVDGAAKKAKKKKAAQLDEEQLFEVATQRLQQRSSALAELSVEQLRSFMSILHLQPAKLAKAGVLTPAEVGRGAHKQKDRTTKAKPAIDLPAACVEALRAGGFDASDEVIAALVNTIRVQPKRFRRLGLVPRDGNSEFEGGKRGKSVRKHGGWYGRHENEEPIPSTEEEWAAALPENSDLLFEQAVLRTETEASAEQLKALMRVLRIPFKRLEQAGLLSEMEVRGDGTGSDKLAEQLPKSNPGFAARVKHYAPFLAQALQSHDVDLNPPTLQRLLEVLRVRPCRFVRMGIVDHDSWMEQRTAFRTERIRARQTSGVAGVGRWFAQMFGMTEQSRDEPPQHPGHPAHHGHSHGHGHHHGHHHGHGPRHHGCHNHRPHGGRGYHSGRFHRLHGHCHHAQQAVPTPTATVAAAVATETPAAEGCVMFERQAARVHDREDDRRFPTNASMAQIVPVEGRQAGKVVSSDVRFEQRWKVQNNHTHPWPGVVEIIPDNDDAVTLGITEPVTMSIGVQPQQAVDIAIIMHAPTAPGLYRPRFRLRDGQTALAFGQRLTAEVLVVDPNQPQQHEPQLPPRPQFGGHRRRMMMMKKKPFYGAGADY